MTGLNDSERESAAWAQQTLSRWADDVPEEMEAEAGILRKAADFFADPDQTLSVARPDGDSKPWTNADLIAFVRQFEWPEMCALERVAKAKGQRLFPYSRETIVWDWK